MTNELISGLRFLVVDDEDAPRNGVAKMIPMAIRGSVETATDAESGLALFQSKPSEFDVILTDNNMPGLTGIESATEYRLRALRASIPARPLFVLSGRVNELNYPPEDLAKLGVDGIFSKVLRLPDYRNIEALARRIILDRQSPKA